jgi:hypothetical protein
MEIDMKRETYSNISSLIINGKKSVFIRSWENTDVEVRFPENKECLIGESKGTLSIDAKSYLILSIPKNISIFADHIYGNLETAGQLQKLNIESVSGNCSIASVESISVENISGNCKVGYVEKDTNIRNVSGNFSVSTVEGSLKVNGVGGNFSGKADSVILSTTVGGNIKITANRIQRSENEVRAGGSIKLSLMDLTDTSIKAKAGGIVSFEKDGQIEKFHNGKYETTIGSGENKISLKAGGNVKVSDQAIEMEFPDNFGTTDDDYVEQIEQKYEARARQTSGFDFSDLFDIEGEIKERMREKTEMADEKIQRAMEKMERKFSFREEFGTAPRPPRPPSPPFPTQSRATKTSPVSTEERLMVLQMLQDKKISAEEADRLLKALEQS